VRHAADGIVDAALQVDVAAKRLMLLGRNCAQPMAPAYEPLTLSARMPSRRASTSSSSSSLRKNALRSLRPVGKSKLSVASASSTRKLPVMRP
jgi:hypothetical protein